MLYGIAQEFDADEIVRKPLTIIGDDPRVDVLTVAATVTFEQAYPRRITRRFSGMPGSRTLTARISYVKTPDAPRIQADVERLRKG